MTLKGKWAEARGRKLSERAKGRAELLEWTRQNGELVPDEEEQLRIAGLTASEVSAEIKSGKLTCTAVMVTMCLRARKAGEVLHATTEEFFLKGIQDAQAMDEKIAREGVEACGPLVGVPLSIKDHIDVVGQDSSCGIAARLFEPRDANAVPVQALLDAGCIPYVKSNVPLSLMVNESVNDIFGRTSNPFDLSRTCGGSSGGEGALVGSGASILGLGTDIGGSVRIPGAYCGVVAFKCTPERISPKGISAPQKGRVNGQQVIKSSPGPLAKSVEDVQNFMMAWCGPESSMFKNDPQVPPFHFRKFRSLSEMPKLKIGILKNDGWFAIAPGCQRALDTAVSTLMGLGHELVPFEVPMMDIHEHVRLYIGCMGAEGGLQNLRRGLDGSPLIKEYRELKTLSSLPNWLKTVVAPILRFVGEKRKAFALQAAIKRSVIQYYDLIREVMNYRAAFTRKMEDEGLHAIICPGVPMPAIPHGFSKDLALSMSYTYLWNLLHFPTGTVPITANRDDEEFFEDTFNDSWTKIAKAAMKNTTGLPLAVQIVTKPWQDELCLEVMRQLDENTERDFTPALDILH